MTLSYIFFGTPESCLPVLNELSVAGRLPLAVVCQPDRPKGRGCKLCLPPTKSWAEKSTIPVLQPATCKDQYFLDEIRKLKPDLGLVFAFGQLLPKNLLDIPRLGFINIHPSLLPRYRGAAPVQHTLMRGDAITGVSILQVTPRLDDGDVILKQTTQVDPEENAVELQARLVRLGAELVVKSFTLIENGTLQTEPQDESEVVWASALKKEDGEIDWNLPAEMIHNRIRGVQPWPGATTRLKGRLLKICRATIGQGDYPEIEPGCVVEASGDDLSVKTEDGIIKIIELQLEGKKRLPVRSFITGRQVQVGDCLG